LAAAVEFSDRAIKRPSRGWTRQIELRIPVHDPARWNKPDVFNSLHEALEFLTGDLWKVEFIKRMKTELPPAQESLQLRRSTKAVIAYSDGMDSRAVAGLLGKALGDVLIRVRVGAKAASKPIVDGRLQPFTKVPYKFKSVLTNGETTARSRGFRFALISGLAAYLANAGEILIPESGQGVFGPALVTVSHAYPDYRNHPRFTRLMSRFLKALLGHAAEFRFPRLWHTKGGDPSRICGPSRRSRVARHQILLARQPMESAERKEASVRCMCGLHAAPYECARSGPRRRVGNVYLR
jgi:hypothetical protein